MCRTYERMWRAGGAMKISFLSFFILLCFLLNGCASETTNRYLISAAEGSEEYTSIVNTYLSDYECREQKDNIYAEISKGNAVACFDIQAISAMNNGIGRYWYPHMLCTVVIAVDRTQTDVSITGWNSLKQNNVPVGIGSTSIIRNMLAMGAISYGLNQKEHSKEETLLFLEYLNQNGGFELENLDAPILICMDYEAAAWNRNGGNYEIIVPTEGTLSYYMGLLSDVPLTLDFGLDNGLLSAGLPLNNGNKPQDFPKNYISAHILAEEDYDWFLDITGDSSRDLRRQVFHSRLYTTADLREHILFAILIIVIILLWKGTVSHRMIRKDVRKAVSIMGWLMVGWLLLRLLKYQLASDSIICRMCWYGYYIFQLALPVTLFYLTVIMDKKEMEMQLQLHLLLPFIIYVLSVLLVMTNDLHQLVFIFDLNGNWSSDYSYGLGYWIITCFSLIFFLLATGKLIFKRGRSVYWGSKVFPLLFVLALFMYIFAYIKRIPLIWESDLTVSICTISVLFFETLLHSGLIPVNTQYQRLFVSAPIGLTLLDETGKTILSSQGVSPVSRSVWKRLLMDINNPLLRDKDTQLHAIPIHGGMAVWQENISVLNRIQNEIQNVQIRLEAANALLLEEEEVKKRLLTAETNRNLFEHLDRDMEHRIASLTNLIENLTDTEHPKDMVAYITLCLCHIKRRCNLFFMVRQGESLLGDELSIYLDELVELARYTGLHILIRCEQNSTLEIRRATLCYDFAFEIISCTIKEVSSPLMGYLEQKGGQLIFRFISDSDHEKWHFSDELMTAVSALGGLISCKDLDDAIGIYMTLPLRR